MTLICTKFEYNVNLITVIHFACALYCDVGKLYNIPVDEFV